MKASGAPRVSGRSRFALHAAGQLAAKGFPALTEKYFWDTLLLPYSLGHNNP